MMLKKNICLKCLKIYTEKTVQKHLNFVCSVETVFHLMSENFLKNEAKILYIMQFWWENHEMHDINIRKLFLLRISHESTSSTIFSILLKIWWIISCIMHRHTLRLYRSWVKVHTFAAYLSTLKAQLTLYNKKQLVMHFFTKLQLKIKRSC
jgi:hypothetical protein